MRPRTLHRLLANGRLRLLLGAMRLLTPFYRLVWLASAARQGLLVRLADGPVAFSDLARELAPAKDSEGALRAWLQVGVRLGEIEAGSRGYSPRSLLARRLARPEHDAVAAIFEELAGLHHTRPHRDR